MSRSDIFDNYAKIAEEQGIVNLTDDEPKTQPDKPKESAKLRRYKKSPAPRAGSDDISTIEALYGVKPNNSIEYEHNIMEAAHSKSVVIAPSYDRINGLVENNIERQNIMSNIALKPTTGNLTGHKYAKKELLMELVRLANDMDNMGHDKLRVIADRCVEELSTEKKKFKKEALAPLVIAAIGAAVLAGIWLWSHANDPDKGLINNLDNATDQLNDLKTNSWYESSIDEVVQRDVDVLLNYINNLKKYVVDFNNAISNIYKPNSLEDKNQLFKFQNSLEKNGINTKDKIEKFVQALDVAIPEIIKGINNFSSSYYQKQHLKPSTVGNISGWLGEAVHGRWGLVANDFISAVNALNTLKDSLVEARKLANNYDQVKEQKQQELEEQVSDLKQKSSPGGLEESDEMEDQSSDEEPEEIDSEEQAPAEEQDIYSNISGFLGHKPTKKEIDFFRSIK